MVKFSKRRPMMNRGCINDVEWIPVEIDNKEELTLLSAVCQVVEVISDSQYDSRIYEVADRPISYIANKLNLTPQQTIVYAIVMNMYYDYQISTLDISRCLDISPLKAMMFSADLEELHRRGYLAYNFDEENTDKSYRVTKDAIDSLKQDCAISYRNLEAVNAEEWFSMLDKIINARCNRNIDYSTLCLRVDNLIRHNRKLPMIKRFIPKYKSLKVKDRMLFMWVCNMVVSDGFETIVPDNFRKLYDDTTTYSIQRKSLSSGSNALITGGLLRVVQTNELKSKDNYELTPWVIKDMLAELELNIGTTTKNDILDHSTITPKQLYYNPTEQKAIDRLTSLLQPQRFKEVSNELREQGFRSGFACLFHGAPGTGKTETVLQLARATGRDIMQVNISSVKSMWVGESEKNIKAIFSRYRKLAQESEIAPILLFNEADAIIGKRLQNVARSVDKMENAIQNILLEEIEQLNGILIATTNLTCNMDKAFERRFLYKIEFEQPSIEAKCAIWQSMIPNLAAQDATALAAKYDFSGGQIENIARKSIVDKLLSGEDMSFGSLCGLCDSELLNSKNHRNRIGY